MKYLKSKWISCWIFLFLITLCLPMRIFAAETINLERPISLTLTYQKEGVVIPGAAFDFYKVADVDQHSAMVVTDTFAPYKESVSGLASLETIKDQDEWSSLASTLENVITKDVLPILHQCTDAKGVLKNNQLKAGLYLVLSEDKKVNDFVYSTEPILLFLPGTDANGWAYTYDVSLAPKSNKVPAPIAPVHISVEKVWKDHDATARPEVFVSLIKDGVLYQEVALNAANHWQYRWENLDPNAEYKVVERAVPGYLMTIQRSGSTFVITNTSVQGLPPKLPVTGLLWWPVPILLGLGILFLVFGRLVDRGKS